MSGDAGIQTTVTTTATATTTATTATSQTTITPTATTTDTTDTTSNNDKNNMHLHTPTATTGDVIEIKGKRRTVAKCLPLYPSDEGKGIIRIDGLGRNNSGIAIGDTITVKKIKAVAAERIVVAPLESIPPIDERY